MVTAMWYVLRTGVPWRDLPPCFGPWSSVYTRFRRWCASGLWARMFSLLKQGAFGRIRSIDCSHVKVHRDGAGPIEHRAAEALGRTQGGLNTKLAAVVDGVGRAVALNLAPGSQHDLRACEVLEPQLRNSWTIADRGFDSEDFRSRLARNGAMVCIPPRSRRHTVFYFNRKLYRHRHTVENFFSRIKRHRRIATRYEKLAETYFGFVYFAAVLDWLNHEV
jgi:transposase